MVKTTWRDDQFDYFMTSDGVLYFVPRNFERERADAEFARAMYWINIQNRALLYFGVAFVSVDLTVLALLLFGGAR